MGDVSDGISDLSSLNSWLIKGMFSYYVYIIALLYVFRHVSYNLCMFYKILTMQRVKILPSFQTI